MKAKHPTLTARSIRMHTAYATPPRAVPTAGDDPGPWDALAIACRLAAAGEQPRIETLLTAVGSWHRTKRDAGETVCAPCQERS